MRISFIFRIWKFKSPDYYNVILLNFFLSFSAFLSLSFLLSLLPSSFPPYLLPFLFSFILKSHSVTQVGLGFFIKRLGYLKSIFMLGQNYLRACNSWPTGQKKAFLKYFMAYKIKKSLLVLSYISTSLY